MISTVFPSIEKWSFLVLVLFFRETSLKEKSFVFRQIRYPHETVKNAFEHEARHS